MSQTERNISEDRLTSSIVILSHADTAELREVKEKLFVVHSILVNFC